MPCPFSYTTVAATNAGWPSRFGRFIIRMYVQGPRVATISASRDLRSKPRVFSESLIVVESLYQLNSFKSRQVDPRQAVSILEGIWITSLGFIR